MNISTRVLATLTGLIFLSSSVYAIPGSDDPALRNRMQKAFSAFSELQHYLLSEERFTAEESTDRITQLLKDLRQGFKLVKQEGHSDEPGFDRTLVELNDMLDDAWTRYQEGKKGYAFWRLRKAGTYCISCHTRQQVKYDFYPPESELQGLTEFQRADFYLASRQFEKARSAFIAIAKNPELRHQRGDALRKVLMIDTRVHPGPDRAIADLNRLRNSQQLSPLEEDETKGWLRSLLRWKNESGKVPPLVRAENLIQTGLGTYDPIQGQMSEIELLRATALLHQELENKNVAPANKRHALYLLGLAYSKLPHIFIDELPESFLEQCIREFPNTEDARNSYRVYREIIILGFTGSGGEMVPDDVALNLKELESLAFSQTKFGGSI